MKYSDYRFTLDVQKHQAQVSVPVKLGDTARRLCISLTNGSKPFSVIEGCIATFNAKKPNGDILKNACIIERDTIIYEFTEQTTNVEGIVNCDITIYDIDGKVLYSPQFILIVDKSVVRDEEVAVSQDQYTALSEIFAQEAQRQVAEAERAATFAASQSEREWAFSLKEQDWESRFTAAENERENTFSQNETGRNIFEEERKASETARVYAETVRDTAEKARISAEEERRSAETWRIVDEINRNNNDLARGDAERYRANQETLRQASEEERNSSELNRLENESNRQNYEKQRQDNETARVNAEKTRANTFSAKMSEIQTDYDNFMGGLLVKTRNLANLTFENAIITATGAYQKESTGVSAAASPTYISVASGQTYTVSWKKNEKVSYIYVHEYTADNTRIKTTRLGDIKVISTYTITLDSSCAYIRIHFYAEQEPWENLVAKNLQIELGTEATPYIRPYVIEQANLDLEGVARTADLEVVKASLREVLDEIIEIQNKLIGGGA